MPDPNQPPSNDRPRNVVPLALAALLVEGETARAIPGYTSYFATSLGRVISTARGKKPRVLSGWRATNGYRQVRLFPDDRESGGKRSWNPTVHKCVILAFVGPPPVDPDDPHAEYDCCHNDGDQENNALSNLRWDGKGPNQRQKYCDGYRAGTRPGTGLAPIAVWKLRCRALVEPVPALLTEFAEAYGVQEAAVRKALRGKTWDWVPFPQDPPTVAEFARKLRVTEGEAAELLALAHPGSGREAA